MDFKQLFSLHLQRSTLTQSTVLLHLWTILVSLIFLILANLKLIKGEYKCNKFKLINLRIKLLVNRYWDQLKTNKLIITINRESLKLTDQDQMKIKTVLVRIIVMVRIVSIWNNFKINFRTVIFPSSRQLLIMMMNISIVH